MMSSLNEQDWQISKIQEREGNWIVCIWLQALGEGGRGEGVGAAHLWAAVSTGLQAPLAAMLFETLSALWRPQSIGVAEACFVKSRQQTAAHNGLLGRRRADRL